MTRITFRVQVNGKTFAQQERCINLLHVKECEEEALGRESHPDKYLTEDSYPEYIQLEKKDQRNK